MYLSGIEWNSISDGEGFRVTIFISGCKWNCKGCHNKDTHSFSNGVLFTDDIQKSIIEYIKKATFIKGITISGGDPMFSAKDVIEFVKVIKNELPYIDIWLYTGFTYDVILKDKDEKYELLQLIDTLVDGKFDIDKRDITLPYKGSKNQRIIDVKKSLKENKIIKYIE